MECINCCSQTWRSQVAENENPIGSEDEEEVADVKEIAEDLHNEEEEGDVAEG